MVSLAFFKFRGQPSDIVLFFGLAADGVYDDRILARGHGERCAEPVKAALGGDARGLFEAYLKALEASFALLRLVFKPLYARKNGTGDIVFPVRTYNDHA